MLDPIERMEELERLMLLPPDQLEAEAEAERRWRQMMKKAARAERDEAMWQEYQAHQDHTHHHQDDAYPW